MKRFSYFVFTFLTIISLYAQPNWTPVNYTNSTTAYGIVTIDGTPAASGDKVGSFVGSECRAIGNVVINTGTAYVTLIIQGEQVELASFKVWQASTNTILGVALTTQTNPGGVLGSPPNYLAIAAASANNTLVVTPDYQDVNSTAGTTTFNVSNSGSGTMNWTAVTNTSWMTITSGSSGINTGTINVSYTANSGVARTGTITIISSGATGSPKTVEVRQAATPVQLADLTVTSASFTPLTIAPGQTLTINASVKNEGGAGAGSSVLAYYLSSNTNITTSDYLLGTTNVPLLSPGSMSNQQLTVTFPSNSIVPKGTYYVAWICDANNQVNESNENNGYYLPSPQLTVTANGTNISVKTPIPKQWLVLSQDPRIYSLTNTFQGNVGTLTYVVQSSNSAIVTASIQGSSLTLTPIAVGDAVISITATDLSNNDYIVYSFDVNVGLTGVDDVSLPSHFMLLQNYPNPFNPSTTIRFSIPTSPVPSPYQGEGLRERLVTLKVYDLLGREIVTLVNEEKSPGNYEVIFNAETFHGTSLPSGVYFYRLQAGEFLQTKKFILLK